MPVSCGYSNPIDFLEYVLRCQNWGDNTTGTPSASALIRSGVGVSGSFDSVSLDPVKAINIRYQIDSVDDSSTKDIIDKICKQFSLIQYTDTSGYECVRYLYADASDTPVPVLYIDDNLDKLVDYQEPDITKICVNPVIKYSYDYATQEYKDQIYIKNVQTGVYNAAYTSGFTGGDGLTYWNRMRTELWPIVKHVEQMDSEWIENQFIVDYAGAIFRLNNVINMMKTGFIDFELPFELGYLYNAGDIVLINYPHLSWTGEDMKLCTIKNISKDKDANSCSISGFTRDVIVGQFYQVEDILGEYTPENTRL